MLSQIGSVFQSFSCFDKCQAGGPITTGERYRKNGYKTRNEKERKGREREIWFWNSFKYNLISNKHRHLLPASIYGTFQCHSFFSISWQRDHINGNVYHPRCPHSPRFPRAQHIWLFITRYCQDFGFLSEHWQVSYVEYENNQILQLCTNLYHAAYN